MITFILVLVAFYFFGKHTRGWPRIVLLSLLTIGFLFWLLTML